MDEYKRSFSVIAAYEFLNRNGLETESEEIRTSPTAFKSYTSTLRRAKIIVLVKQHGLFQKFCEEVWPSGLTKKGESRARFFENLAKRSSSDEEGITTEEEDELIEEDNEFAYENDLQNYLIKNLGAIERGLKLYESEGGQSGVEFYVPDTSRRIDILAVDQNGLLCSYRVKGKSRLRTGCRADAFLSVEYQDAFPTRTRPRDHRCPRDFARIEGGHTVFIGF